MANWGSTTDIIKVFEKYDGGFIYPWNSKYISEQTVSYYQFNNLGNSEHFSNPLNNIGWWLRNGYFSRTINNIEVWENRKPFILGYLPNDCFVGVYIAVDEFNNFITLLANSFDYRGEKTEQNPKGIRSLNLVAYSFDNVLREEAYSNGFNVIFRYDYVEDYYYLAVGYRQLVSNDTYTEFTEYERIFEDSVNPSIVNTGTVLEPPTDASMWAIDIREVSLTYFDGNTIEYLRLVNAIDSVDSSDYDDSFGVWDNSSDDILLPDLPWKGAVASGFVKLYRPNEDILNELARFLWSPSFYDAISTNFAEPMEMIISLHLIPYPLVASSGANIGIGGLDTQIYSPVILNQYIEVDCGTIDIKENYASALDYNNSDILIYLPFVGVETIKADECMDGKIRVVYHIDLLSGGFVAFIIVTRHELNSILYHFTGNMSVEIPINATNRGNIQRDIIHQVANTVVGGAVGGAVGVATGLLNTAINAKLTKPNVQRSGSVSGSTGFLDSMKPYLIITRPVQSLPQNYASFNGYTSNVTSTLSALKGFTKIEKVIGDGLTCDKDESNDIITLLKEGVIL